MLGMARGRDHASGAAIGRTVLTEVGSGPALSATKITSRGKTTTKGHNVGGYLSEGISIVS